MEADPQRQRSPEPAPVDVSVNYIHCTTSPGPVLGLATYEGVHSIVEQMRGLGDPGFTAVPLTFLGPHTHANRMSQMPRAVETVTRMIGRPRQYGEYNPAVIARASAHWPADKAAVLFACTPGDRDQYPIFRELDDMKAQYISLLDQVRALDEANPIGYQDRETFMKREKLIRDIEKLQIAIGTLEESAELIAMMRWAESPWHGEQPQYIIREIIPAE